jgi:hypothetical protein
MALFLIIFGAVFLAVLMAVNIRVVLGIVGILLVLGIVGEDANYLVPVGLVIAGLIIVYKWQRGDFQRSRRQQGDDVVKSGPWALTHQLRTTPVEEKTCPKCVERVKAAALVCHFCGHEFPIDEVKKGMLTEGTYQGYHYVQRSDGTADLTLFRRIEKFSNDRLSQGICRPHRAVNIARSNSPKLRVPRPQCRPRSLARPIVSGIVIFAYVFAKVAGNGNPFVLLFPRGSAVRV